MMQTAIEGRIFLAIGGAMHRLIVQIFAMVALAIVAISVLPQQSQAQEISVEALSPYTSGNNTVFRFTTSSQFSTETQIRYTYTQVDSSGRSGSLIYRADFPANQTHFDLTVPLPRPLTSYERLVITVETQGSTRPKPGMKSASAYITVDGKPGISVSADKSEMFAGENAVFSLKLSARPGHTVRHNLKVTWSPAGLVTSACGSTLANVGTATSHTCPEAARFWSGDTSSSGRTIVTDRTKLNGSDGWIKVSADPNQDFSHLSDPTYAPVYNNPNTNTATVIVKDRNPPVLKILDAPTVKENQGPAVFKLESTLPRTVTVYYTPTNTVSNFLNETDTSATSDGPSGQQRSVELTFDRENMSAPYTADLEIPLDDDGNAEVTGTITVTLDDDEADPITYTVDSNNSTAEGTIEDDDQATVSIDSPAAVIEGDSSDAQVFLRFTVTATARLNQNFDVPYTVAHHGTHPTQEDDFITGQGESVTDGGTLEFRTTTTPSVENTPLSMQISFEVNRDDEYEPNETIRVSLGTITGDAVTMGFISATPATATGDGTITDDDPATVSIDSPAAVIEGDSSDAQVFLRFTVSATARLNQNFDVPYTVAHHGTHPTREDDFITGQSESVTDVGTLEFRTTTTPSVENTPLSMQISFEINRDDEPEPNETISVSLDTITGDAVTMGLIDATPATATGIGTITDDDRATVSIDSPAPVMEGDSSDAQVFLRFTVAATERLDQNFDVPYTVAHHGTHPTHEDDFITGQSESVTDGGTLEFRTTTTPSLENTPFSMQISFEINRDDEHEPNETIRVSLGTITGNAVTMGLLSATPATATGVGTITDDDPAVTVSVVADRNEINEGESVRFTFSSNSETDLTNIAYSIEQRGNHVVWSTRKSVRISVNEETSLNVVTAVDPTDMTNGSITVRILNGADYVAHGNYGMARVLVMNNDAVGQRYSVAGSAIVSILTEQPSSPASPQSNSYPSVPEISIVALVSTVNEGYPAKFRVESSKTTGNRLTVRLRIDRTNEIIGGSSTISAVMKPGVRSVPLELTTDDDDLAGSDGRLTATVLTGDGYRIGADGSASVVISDEPDRLAELNRTTLPEIAATIGARTLDATGSRVLQAFSSDSQTGLNLAGGSTFREVLETGGSMLNEDEFNWFSLLGGSSFSTTLYPESGASGLASIWGFGNHRVLSSDGSQSWSGNAFTGHLGFDTIVGQGLLAGMVGSATQADVEIEENDTSGTLLGIQSTGIHPYFGLVSSNGDARLLLTAGYGVSELKLDSDRYSTGNLNGDFHTFGLETSSRLFAGEGFLFGGHSNLILAGETWMVQQSLNAPTGNSDPLRTVANHMRIAVEGMHVQALTPGHKISPSISVGMRRDGRNVLTAYGYEIGSSVSYEASHGFSIDASGLAVISGRNQIDEWEMLSSMDYDAGKDGLGVLASIEPTWGGTGQNERKLLWDRDFLENSDSSDIRLNTTRMDSEIGYGFTLADGLWKLQPYGGVSLTEGNSKEIRLGNRFWTGEGISFEIEGLETFESRDIRLTGDIRW